MYMFKTLFGWPKEEPKTDFSAFFRDASSQEKKKLLKEVVREANKDQRELIEKHRNLKTKTAH